jgi:hypothetical protein
VQESRLKSYMDLVSFQAVTYNKMVFYMLCHFSLRLIIKAKIKEKHERNRLSSTNKIPGPGSQI